MISLVCYASDNMTISQENLIVSSLKNGVDRTFSYGVKDIDPFFFGVNKEILTSEIGAGYWLWKPYVVNKALLECQDGDILIYSDAGVKILENVEHIIKQMKEDIFLFNNGWKQVEWCKGNVLRTILGIDWRQHEDKTQVQASVIFMKVTEFTRKFMREWLMWCQIPGFIDDSKSEFNFETFADHRHDQAILCCLQIKYGLKLHFWSTRYSEHLPKTDLYPTMFDHHRRRNGEW
jgi:hypothetical protein